MIDLNKYVEVKFDELFDRRGKGEKFFDNYGGMFKLSQDGSLMNWDGRCWLKYSFQYHDVIDREWFLKKPFSAQQAMVNNPNAWVAVYETDECKHWYKVGLELETMCVVTLPYEKDEKVTSNHVKYPDDIELEDILKKCVDIEDIPQSVKNHADLFKKKKYVKYVSPSLLYWFKDTYKHLSDEDLDKVLSGIVEYKDDSSSVEFMCKTVAIPYSSISMPQVRFKIHEETAKLYGIREEFPHFADDKGVLVIKYETPQDVL